MGGSLPKIFVISLPHSGDRRERFAHRMDALNLSFEFLDAFDGRGLADSDVRVDWEQVRKHPAWLTPGALGCALSHFAAYDKVVRLRLPSAVILEDDCVPCRDFRRILEHLPDQLTGRTVLMLYYACPETLQLEKSSRLEVYGRYGSVTAKNIERVSGAVAYAVTLDAASSMRQAILPIRVAPDSWGCFCANGMIDTMRFMHPMCCGHHDGKSTIDYFGEAKLKRGLSLFIDQTRVFPAYQILKLRRRRLNEKMHRVQLV